MRSFTSVLSLISLAGGLAAAGACGASVAEIGPGAGDGGPSTIDPGVSGVLPCDVDKVLAAHCRSCHDTSPKFGSLVPLVTWADLQKPAASDSSRKVHELVVERITNDVRPMPQPPNARLSDADRATLTKWSAAGAPASGPVDCSIAPPPPVTMTTCKPDLPIGPGSDWEMPTDTGDEYVCYGVELSRPSPTHVVGFSPRIDNAKIVHHVVLFEADSAVSATPTKCGAGGSLQWRMVTGWAPGGKGFELPPEAGFPLKTTGSTHYVVQMHYSNPQALAGQKDHSGFDLCTSAPRQYEADVLAFGTQSIDIPAGAAYDRVCSITVPQQLAGIHLIASMPHMHKLGTVMSTQLFAGGPSGAASDLGTTNAWDFNNQPWLDIKGSGAPGTGVVAKAGDVITTRCAWKNVTGANVKFGEKTAEEMCYSFTTYYPRIASAVWSWAAPALTSTCK